jgi:hypothetical protein
MLSVRENYCLDQVTFSRAELSHPTTLAMQCADSYLWTVCFAWALSLNLHLNDFQMCSMWWEGVSQGYRPWVPCVSTRASQGSTIDLLIYPLFQPFLFSTTPLPIPVVAYSWQVSFYERFRAVKLYVESGVGEWSI